MPLTSLRRISCHLAWSGARLKFRPSDVCALFREKISGPINYGFAKAAGCPIIPRMKTVLWISASCAFVLAFSSCANSGRGSAGTQLAGTGPFDKNGRYVEEWADNPSKWRKPGSAPSPHETQSDDLPQIAQNEQPPQNSNPLPPGGVSKPVPVISQTQVTSKSKSTKSKFKPTVAKSEPVEIKSKPVVVKTKAKLKPKSTRYVVKSGDSLSAIASRTGSSVSAIKSANGISGTLIRPGQSLTIPRK